MNGLLTAVPFQDGECVLVHLSKEQIDFDLQGYSLRVTASQMHEDGYLLIIEGDWFELQELIVEWGPLCEVQ